MSTLLFFVYAIVVISITLISLAFDKNKRKYGMKEFELSSKEDNKIHKKIKNNKIRDILVVLLLLIPTFFITIFAHIPALEFQSRILVKMDGILVSEVLNSFVNLISAFIGLGVSSILLTLLWLIFKNNQIKNSLIFDFIKSLKAPLDVEDEDMDNVYEKYDLTLIANYRARLIIIFGSLLVFFGLFIIFIFLTNYKVVSNEGVYFNSIVPAENKLINWSQIEQLNFYLQDRSLKREDGDYFPIMSFSKFNSNDQFELINYQNWGTIDLNDFESIFKEFRKNNIKINIVDPSQETKNLINYYANRFRKRGESSLSVDAAKRVFKMFDIAKKYRVN